MKYRKRILIIDPYSQIGGPHQVMVQIVSQISKKGWEVIVIIPEKGPTYYQFKQLDVEVIVMSGVIALRRDMKLKEIFEFIFMGFLSIFRIINIIKTRKIYLVHSATITSWWGGIAAQLANVPSIYHIHDLTLGHSRLISEIIGNVLYYTSDRIICVSEAARNALPLYKKNLEKAIVIYV